MDIHTKFKPGDVAYTWAYNHDFNGMTFVKVHISKLYISVHLGKVGISYYCVEDGDKSWYTFSRVENNLYPTIKAIKEAKKNDTENRFKEWRSRNDVNFKNV